MTWAAIKEVLFGPIGKALAAIGLLLGAFFYIKGLGRAQRIAEEQGRALEQATTRKDKDDEIRGLPDDDLHRRGDRWVQ